MINFYTTDDDEEEPRNFLYNNNESVNDASFVSIDLNDDKNECDICHQVTEEPTVSVMLSDEYLKFEGSLKRTGDSLTKAHEICLERWSEVIERNLDNSNTTNDIYNENSNTPSRITIEEVKHTKDLDYYETEKYNCDSENGNIEKQSHDLCSSIKSHTLPKHMLTDKSK